MGMRYAFALCALHFAAGSEEENKAG
jgi:hypothetical protein